MTNLIVNEDVTHHIIRFLSLKGVVSLLQVNNSCYQLISSTCLFRELVLLKEKPTNIFIGCYQKGLTKVLDALYNDQKIYWYPAAVDDAAKNGHTSVLDWIASKFTLKSFESESSLRYLEKEGQLFSFKEFNKPGLKYFYYCEAIDEATKNNQIAVLDWFLKSGLKFDYYFAIKNTVRTKRTDVLYWFLNSGLRLDYRWIIKNATKNNRLIVIEWLRSHAVVLDNIVHF